MVVAQNRLNNDLRGWGRSSHKLLSRQTDWVLLGSCHRTDSNQHLAVILFKLTIYYVVMTAKSLVSTILPQLSTCRKIQEALWGGI